MTADELRAYLEERQIAFTAKEVQNGTQFRCSGGEVFTVYTTGKLVPGGKVSPLSKEVRAFAEAPPAAVAAQPAPTVKTTTPGQDVFIVAGHDKASRESLEFLLRRMGLTPVILQNLPVSGETVIEKLEQYIGQHGKVGFACVLLTPDDEGYRVGSAEERKYRARQNVVLELGMVLASLGRSRVAIITKESVERPSDIGGLIYIPFKEHLDEIKVELLKTLQAAGYACSTQHL